MPAVFAFLSTPLGGLILRGLLLVASHILSSFLRRRDSRDSSRRRASSTIRAAITPAKWHFGKTRTFGTLTQIAWAGRTLRMCLVIGEAPIAGVSRVWIQGRGVDKVLQQNTWVSFSADEALGDGGSDTVMRVLSFFDGASVAGNAKIWNNWSDRGDAEGLVWDTTNFQMQGLAFCIIECRQDEDQSFWRGIPEVEFLIDGFRYDGSTITNAAQVRRWWEIEREDELATRIDSVSYNAAVALCTTQGFMIQGTVESTDDPEQIRAAFDFAWDGTVVDWAGRLRFLPGTARTPTVVIDADDLLEIPTTRTAPDLHDRVNTVDMVLSQSEDADYQRQSMPTQINQTDIDRDGGSLRHDLGETDYVIDPQIGVNLMSRYLISPKGLRIRIRVPYGTETAPHMYLGLAPGDVVTLTLPGVTSRSYLVLGSAPGDEDTLVIELQEELADRYTAVGTPPVSPPMPMVMGPPVGSPASTAPFGLVAVFTAEGIVRATWSANDASVGWRVSLHYTRGANTQTEIDAATFRAGERSHEFTVHTGAQNLQVQLVMHVSGRRESPSAVVDVMVPTFSISGSTTPVVGSTNDPDNDIHQYQLSFVDGVTVRIPGAAMADGVDDYLGRIVVASEGSGGLGVCNVRIGDPAVHGNNLSPAVRTGVRLSMTMGSMSFVLNGLLDPDEMDAYRIVGVETAGEIARELTRLAGLTPPQVFPDIDWELSYDV